MAGGSVIIEIMRLRPWQERVALWLFVGCGTISDRQVAFSPKTP